LAVAPGPAEKGEPLPAQPLVLDPRAVFTADEVRRALRLKASTIRRELREGRLRVSKRAGRYYILGRWLLEWIEAGELPRPVGAAGGRPSHNGKAEQPGPAT